MSQFFFFREWIKKALVRHAPVFAPTMRGGKKSVATIYDTLLSDPRRLTVQQMHALVKANPFSFEYLYGLGREFPADRMKLVTLSRDAKTKAIRNLRQDFDVVGITESMPTLFALLSRAARIPLGHLCETRDVSLGIGTLYSSTFGAPKRPKGMDLFSDAVFNALREEMAESIEVYETARTLHLSQLRNAFPEFRAQSDSDLVLSVQHLWAKTCCTAKDLQPTSGMQVQ